jgi:DNA-binding NarL/FixJ family response regulator/tetratricopeptide (TPR) repeat protein
LRPVLCRPFIGRRQELAYLRERRLEAAKSHGGLVLVAGDAGVGKSRLISEFCKSLAYSRWKIGCGACLEFASRPYGPILETLSQVDRQKFELGAASTQREQFEALAARFASISARNALIVVVEDLHWADAATLDFLAYLGARLHRMRVMTIASMRADELHSDHPATSATARIARYARAGVIELGPLRGSELRQFIDEALSGIALPDDLRRAIAKAGDGNPFYTEELLKSAVEQSSPSSHARIEPSLPRTVDATLLERMRPLDDAERRVVTQAAVIGRTFGLDLLAATLGCDEAALLRALRRARNLQLVEEIEPNVFRFRHGLTREAIYREFLSAELPPLHRAIAVALESAHENRRSLEALAYHWWAAKDPAKTAHYNRLAGDEAATIYAHEDAIAFYERALEVETDARARATILHKVADRRLALGSTTEAQATYSAAADAFRAAGELDREAGCRVTAAITAYGTGLPDPTRPLEEMLARLDDADYAARSRVHLGLAWLAATFGFPTRALLHLDHVDARAIAQTEGIALRFHNVAAFVAMTVGDLETFCREHAAWVTAAEGTGSLTTLAGAYTNGAMCRCFFGLHEEAQADIDRALELARRARSRHSEESVHAFAAMCYLLRGDLEPARSELAEVSPASENRVNITFATAWGSIVGATLDDRTLIDRWFDGFEKTIGSAPEVECGAGFAEIMVRRGRYEDAAALLHRALPDCELLRGNVFTLLAVGRYGAVADRERARRYLERAAALNAALPEHAALELFDAIACARSGRSEDAAAFARRAADGFRRLRYPLLEAQALELAGDAAGALSLYRRCGALFDIRRLRSASEIEGLLSARELEVATLAAGGRSNMEIARELSITHKTVEKHLGSAYHKLNISSRAQLEAHVTPRHN